MKLNPQDISVSTYQTNYSGWFPRYDGVCILHIPTGIKVHCATERGQHANKWKALQMLEAKLTKDTDYTYQMELDLQF